MALPNWEWNNHPQCNGRGQGTPPGQAGIQGEVDGVGAGVGEQDGVGTGDVEGEPAVMRHPGHSISAEGATGDEHNPRDPHKLVTSEQWAVHNPSCQMQGEHNKCTWSAAGKTFI